MDTCCKAWISVTVLEGAKPYCTAGAPTCSMLHRLLCLQDESCQSWRDHSHHYLIVSNAGKPVYSRYGDEHKLAAFGGIVQALVSYAASPAAGSDNIQTIRAGLHEVLIPAANQSHVV